MPAVNSLSLTVTRYCYVYSQIRALTFRVRKWSACRRCVTDERTAGFQLLHAVHSVEVFLHGLFQRKCNFHIVFVSTNEKICIPDDTSKNDEIKYILARIAIIRHLEAHLPAQCPAIRISKYPSYLDDAFRDYLTTSGAYFFMCHDGASISRKKIWTPPAKDGQTTSVVEQNEEGVASRAKRAACRSMIHNFMQNGYSVALINGLQWRDTKVRSQRCLKRITNHLHTRLQP